MTGITGLLKIELPNSTVLLNDGGVTVFNGDTYTAEDGVVGSIASIGNIEEGSSQDIPALQISFAPPNIQAVTAFSTGAIQRSRVSLWVAEYDTLTGEVIGTPDLRFTGFVDQPRVSASKREFSLDITAVPSAEELFAATDGIGQSSAAHKRIYPNDTGHDQSVNLSLGTAWGVASPQRAASSFSGGSSRGSFGSGVFSQARLQ